MLRNDCLNGLHKADWPYLSRAEINRYLTQHKVGHTAPTLNRYMKELMDSGIVHGSGRGWYSFLPKPLALDNTPVTEMVELLRAAFPFLRFTCWSTVQVNPWMHHLFGTPTHFVMTARDAWGDVAARMRDAGWNCVVNPRGAQARSFEPGAQTVVLRALHSAAPAPETGGHPALAEQLLVELRLEAETLNLLSVAEFHAMARQMVAAGRINMGEFLHYASKCLMAQSDLFG